VLGSGWGAVSFIKNLDPASFGGAPSMCLYGGSLLMALRVPSCAVHAPEQHACRVLRMVSILLQCGTVACLSSLVPHAHPYTCGCFNPRPAALSAFLSPHLAENGAYELVLVSPRKYMLFTPLLPSELKWGVAGRARLRLTLR